MMYSYDREYKTARAVYAWLEFVGWATVVLGAILVVAGFATGGISGMMYGQRNLPFLPRFLATLPGIGIAIAGLFTVAYVQTSRAHVDTAESSREMLEIARKGQAVTSAPEVARINPSNSASVIVTSDGSEIVKSASAVSEEHVKFYKSYEIRRVNGKYVAAGKEFVGMMAVEQHIDLLQER